MLVRIRGINRTSCRNRPAASDSAPLAGAHFALSATVRNDGVATSTAKTLRYYRSTDETISSADTQMGTSAVPALEASASFALSVTLTAPASGGTYYYGACLDSVKDGSDTTDNCSSSAEVTVLETKRQSQGSPDLAVGSPTVSASSPRDRGVLHTVGDGKQHRRQRV